MSSIEGFRAAAAMLPSTMLRNPEIFRAVITVHELNTRHGSCPDAWVHARLGLGRVQNSGGCLRFLGDCRKVCRPRWFVCLALRPRDRRPRPPMRNDEPTVRLAAFSAFQSIARTLVMAGGTYSPGRSAITVRAHLLQLAARSCAGTRGPVLVLRTR